MTATCRTIGRISCCHQEAFFWLSRREVVGAVCDGVGGGAVGLMSEEEVVWVVGELVGVLGDVV